MVTVTVVSVSLSFTDPRFQSVKTPSSHLCTLFVCLLLMKAASKGHDETDNTLHSLPASRASQLQAQPGSLGFLSEYQHILLLKKLKIFNTN